MSIIKSILDDDLYKFTMQQAVLHQFPGAEAEFKFKCRNEKADLHLVMDDLHYEIQDLKGLQLFKDDEKYLRSIRFLKSDYIDFLKQFRFNPDYVKVRRVYEPPGGISIEIKGPWLQTILFEVPILAIVNELYYRQRKFPATYESVGMAVLFNKITELEKYGPGINFLEFGTRRRFSAKWQREVVQILRKSHCGLIGTSNVLLAKDYDLKPMGTMAHEYLQAGQALGPNLRNSQKFAFQSWVNEYRGDLGIALTDVIGVEAFLKDFDLYFAKLYDGVRHDSGDPFIWAQKMIEHYEKMMIDPMSKTLVFSDGLSFPLAVEIHKAFYKRTKLLFGIGTNLTNDFGIGHDRLDIVIKMIRCNGQSVAKLSDSEGKSMSDDAEYLAHLRKVFQR